MVGDSILILENSCDNPSNDNKKGDSSTNPSPIDDFGNNSNNLNSNNNNRNAMNGNANISKEQMLVQQQKIIAQLLHRYSL